jgi:ribose/xylose/arabinose/galactoside ABC-type transport system permease subunit
VVLSNGTNLIRLPSYTQEAVLGALLVVALIIDRLRRRTAHRPHHRPGVAVGGRP